ncbi:hypothetical protein J6590_107111, partial [Homalodisca vitripennis]
LVRLGDTKDKEQSTTAQESWYPARYSATQVCRERRCPAHYLAPHHEWDRRCPGRPQRVKSAQQSRLRRSMSEYTFMVGKATTCLYCFNEPRLQQPIE